MYKEHDGNEESSQDMNNQPSACDPSTNLQNDISTAMDDTADKVNPVDEDTMSVQSTQLVHEEGHSEDIPQIIGPVRSDSDELTATAMDAGQTGDKDPHEMVHGSSATFSPDKSGLDEATSTISGVLSGGMEKMTQEVCVDTSEKDKTINLLREEVGVCNIMAGFSLNFICNYKLYLKSGFFLSNLVVSSLKEFFGTTLNEIFLCFRLIP